MDRANVITSEADPSNTGWDDGEVRRNRLLERLHSSRGLVLIQAPTGFGKTLLARQLTGDSRWPRRMLVSGNESSAEPQLEDARSSPPDLLVVDDATPAAVDAAASLAATSLDILVVCLGRSLSITPAVRAQRPIRLTHLDLRFDCLLYTSPSPRDS